MKIAVLTVGERGPGGRSTAERALSGIDPDELPREVVLLSRRGGLLETLQAASGFDGLILIDGASMAREAGGFMVFSLNELVLPEPPREVRFENVDIRGEIVYASKFLSLPPVRIIGIETDGGSAVPGVSESCLAAIRKAVGDLS